MSGRLKVPTSFTAGRRFKLGADTYEPGDPVPSREEIQVITITGVSAGDTGSFTLTFSGQTTGNLSGTTTASAVSAALGALSNIAPGDVSVTGSNGGPFHVRFAGAYQSVNVPAITVTNSMAGTNTPSVVITTEYEGGVSVEVLKNQRNLSALINRRYLIPNKTLWGGKANVNKPTPSDLGPSGRKILGL